MKGIRKASSLVLACTLFLGLTANASAASNNKVLDQVRNEYTSFEKKAVKAYEKYRDDTNKEYQAYRDKEQASFDTFVKQTSNDLSQLKQAFEADVAKLEVQFGSNKEYSSKLRTYKSKINASSLSSPMQNYAQSINPTSLASLMSNYKSAINEVSLASPMMKYRNAVNEISLASPMSFYRQAVSAVSLASPMSELRHQSNPTSLASVMQKYKHGKLTQKQALAEWRSILKKETKSIQTIADKTKKDIHTISSTTSNDILTQKSKTVNGILEQRQKTLQEISDTRKDYFGEGISISPLIPDLGEPQMMMNGKWLALPQQPVVQNNVVFVPVRAVFETINPEMKLTKKGDVISISNPAVKVTINSKTASVGGKTITLPAAPKLINGNVMIPLQLVEESYNGTVRWDAALKTVFID
ncbi:copper amine oxidase N-terminal domain-containing protein [Sporosarcina sp. Te-1]|uniref:copper amine oxidase N-terminal domain-containing protein n=1 Tax=Sporosarcina sp. Te-1 TaxID=2818390 RepID=UPI001A9D333C|nr:copper amine oxidase N-terminal domain-containing protein [Sporosarcina sp. Te-1]QTD40063.1 copper amine oxidase N-terminal domain-containing protein [Sporosarcina sp. Te-1]